MKLLLSKLQTIISKIYDTTVFTKKKRAIFQIVPQIVFSLENVIGTCTHKHVLWSTTIGYIILDCLFHNLEQISKYSTNSYVPYFYCNCPSQKKRAYQNITTLRCCYKITKSGHVYI